MILTVGVFDNIRFPFDESVFSYFLNMNNYNSYRRVGYVRGKVF